MYADDTQLYISFTSDEADALLVDSSVVWQRSRPGLVAHKLKLNDDKTVIMEIRSPLSVSGLGDLHIMVGQETITLSEATRNLGGFFWPAL